MKKTRSQNQNHILKSRASQSRMGGCKKVLDSKMCVEGRAHKGLVMMDSAVPLTWLRLVAGFVSWLL